MKELKNQYLSYCFDFKSRLKEHAEVEKNIVDLFIKKFYPEIAKDKKE